MSWSVFITVPGTFLFIAFTVWLLGLRILSLAKVEFQDRLQQHCLGITLGLGIFGFFILLIGLFGILYSWIIWFFLVTLFSANISKIPVAFQDLLFLSGRIVTILKSRSAKSILIGLIIFGMLAALAGVIAPAIGQDAMVYHLSDPKYFALHHKIENVPFSSNSLYPYLTEMYFTAGLVLGSEVLAKLFNFLFALLIILMGYSVARRYLSIRNSLLTAAVGFLSPGILALIGYAYVEIALAAFTLATYICFLELLKTRRMEWVILAGIFLGCCISIKIFGIATFAIMAFLTLISYWREDSLIKGVKICAILSVIGLAVGCIWYIRSTIVWHNPFYPFYFKYIGETGWYRPKLTCPVGVGTNIKNLLIIPWLLVMVPDIFGGGANQLSPIFLLLLPLVIFKFYKNREIKYLTSSLLLFIVFWFFIYQNIRHLTPYTPIFAVVSIFSYVTSFNNSRTLKRWLFGLLVGILFYEAGLGFYYYRDAIYLCLGRHSRRDYIIRHDRSAKTAFYINENLPQDARILVVNELRNYRFDKDVVREPYYWRQTQYDKKAAFPADVIRTLKKDNFDYIVYRESLFKTGDSKKTTIENQFRLTELLKDSRFTDRYLYPMTIFEYKEIDPIHYSRYYLYKIK